MRKKILLSIVTSALVAFAAIASQTANTADDWTPMAKKQLPTSSKGAGNYLLHNITFF